MKTFIKTSLSIICLILAAQVVAEERLLRETQKLDAGAHRGFIETHDAIESKKLRISLDKNNHGFVEGRSCKTCDTIKLTITPETKAFIGKKEVPLSRASDRLGRYATVIYELGSKNISQIRW